MKNSPLIPVLPGTLDGRDVQFVDARRLHTFLGVGRDFSTWIQDRIQEYEFVNGKDFSPKWGKSRGGRPSIDFFLTLDMAKELAMVERTAKGREARRYFIECEHQLHRLHQRTTGLRPAIPIALNSAERQAINRQAWAEVSGQVHAVFHQRREELLQERVTQRRPIYLPHGFVPEWAK